MDPFACSDVTVVKVLEGGKSRVVDAFSHSKYGLEPDEFFGGEQSFTDISASEENGEAIVLFKRSLKGRDVADHTILPGKSQIFWANGPEGNSPVRISGAAHIETMYLDFFNTTLPIIADLEGEDVSTVDTQETTSLPVTNVKKVETVATTERTTEATTELLFIPEVVPVRTEVPRTTATTESNVIDEPDSGEGEVVEPEVQSGDTGHSAPSAEIAPCHGSFVYPPKCNEKCTYGVNWQTDGVNVHFNLWAKLKPKMWSGIGFSAHGAMVSMCTFKPLPYHFSDER